MTTEIERLYQAVDMGAISMILWYRNQTQERKQNHGKETDGRDTEEHGR